MEAGLPIPVIQRLMGRKSISTTLRYLHVSAGYLGTLTSPMELLRMPDLTAGQGGG
jgi:site-specific recombinase XerD